MNFIVFMYVQHNTVGMKNFLHIENHGRIHNAQPAADDIVILPFAWC